MIMSGAGMPIGHDGRHGQATGVHQNLTSPAPDRPRARALAPAHRHLTCATTALSPTSTVTSADGTTLPLCRLRYGGSAHTWGFAIYRASHDDYEDSILPAG